MRPCILLALLSLSRFLAAGPVDDYLASMKASLGGLKTLQADFIQERSLAVFDEALQSQGRLCFASPDRLRWELRKPYHSVLLLNGSGVAKWDIDQGRAKRAKLGGREALQAALGQILAMLRGDFGSIKSGFSMQLALGKNGGPDLLSLKPKGQALGRYLSELKFTIEPQRHRVLELALLEPGGDATVVRFSHQVEDQPLDASVFDLDHPQLDGLKR